MLFLITGQPGNGKTLHTLGLVEKLRSDPASVAIGRKVYYWGIPDLALPWEKLGTDEEWLQARHPKWSGDCPWYDLPDGSIVVIDECQHVFRPRKQGAETPRRVSEFETHRHRGFDVFLITQHPQLIDINVRKLVGRHIHVRRTFGQETATLLQWEVATDPNDRAARNQALSTRWTFPKEHYAWYKSAEVHTVKKELPKKPLLILAGSVVAVALLAWFAGHRLMSQADTAEVAKSSPSSISSPMDMRGPTWSSDAFAPRVDHWSWSQPFYDKVAEVQSAPRVTGCMLMDYGNGKRECKCSNGQGVAQVRPNVCHDFMQGRVYDPLREYEDKKAANIAYLNASNGSGSPGEPASEGQSVENRSTLGAQRE